jgi:meso-butanediol dehydrogenase/(S,S)-butanediol dehydrogenase/diacetyl reductase
MTRSAAEKPVILITGASAGIGEAIARRFAAGGFRIMAVARRQERLSQLANELSAITEIETFAGDVSKSEVPVRAVEATMKAFGRLDCLINNAGSGKWAPPLHTDDAMMDEVIDVSFKAPFRFARESLRVMESGSSIITVGSVYGLMGGLNGGIYGAVKAGLIGMTQALAVEYGSKGIRSNVVAPGVVKTDMTRDFWDAPGFQRSNQEMTPFNRDCTTEDVANTCFFLASAEGSIINGQTIALDGGWSTTKFLSYEALTAKRVPG